MAVANKINSKPVIVIPDKNLISKKSEKTKKIDIIKNDLEILGAPKKEIHILSKSLEAASKLTKIDHKILSSIIHVESKFKKKAVSNEGACGYMQLTRITQKEMKIKNVFSTKENVLGGSMYLRILLDKYNGNLKHALMAYNLGPTNFDRRKRIPKETRDFVKRVYLNYNKQKEFSMENL